MYGSTVVVQGTLSAPPNGLRSGWRPRVGPLAGGWAPFVCVAFLFKPRAHPEEWTASFSGRSGGSRRSTDSAGRGLSLCEMAHRCVAAPGRYAVTARGLARRGPCARRLLRAARTTPPLLRSQGCVGCDLSFINLALREGKNVGDMISWVSGTMSCAAWNLSITFVTLF